MNQNLVKLTLVTVLMVIFSFSVFADTTVDVTIVDYDIIVNGTRILTEESQYPVLNYRYITYFPMTSDYLSGLGLNLRYSHESGLKINKASTVGEFNQTFLGAKTVLGSKTKASIATNAIEVNGKQIINSEEKYPVLVYKNVTYFPMTWRFTSTEFEWTTSWSNETGFGITVNGATSKPNEPVKPVEESGGKLNSSEIAGLKSSIVKIESEGFDGEIWSGNGFYIGEGEIVTNYHLVGFAKTIKITNHDGRVYDGEVIVTGYNDSYDLATIHIETDNDTYLELGHGSSVHLYEHVYAMTSSTDVENNMSDSVINFVDDLIFQMASYLNIGSSGGPLLNDYGQVIGVMRSNHRESDEDLEFAINIDHLDELTMMYDVKTEKYIEPFSNEAKPIENVTTSYDDGFIRISWDNNGADYYKFYLSRDGGPYEEAIRSDQNIWYWYSGGGIRVRVGYDDTISFYITSVKDDIESDYDFITTSSTPRAKANIELKQSQLLEESSTMTTENFNIPIENYFINNTFSETVYVFANIKEGYFDEAIKASLSETDIQQISDQMLEMTLELEETFESPVFLYFTYSGTETERDPILEQYDSFGQVYTVNNDGTWEVFFPIIVTRGDYNGGRTHVTHWLDKETNTRD